MALFDEKPGAGKSSEAELADLMKAEPADTSADTPADTPVETPAEPLAQATETPLTGEPAAETQQEPAAPEPAPVNPKTVPVATLMEERKARQDAEARLARLEGQVQAWQQMQQQQGQPQPGQQQEQPPDPDLDPIGAMKYERQRRENMERHLQQQAVMTRVTQDYTADVARFRGEAPDFTQAYNHLLSMRVAQLQSSGWTDQNAIAQQVRNDEFGLVLQALRSNQSPAKAIYQMAVASGYVAKSAEKPKPIATDPALQEARAKAAAGIAEGGAAPKGELALEDILKLSGAARASAVEAWEKRTFKKSGLFRE